MALVVDPQQSAQRQWALDFLRADRPVALPTETVYGLAGRVFSDLALSRIFALKARPHFDPLIAHVSGIEMARPLCTALDGIEEALMRAFWPGPLTILCQKSARVSELCTAGSPLVALRAPAHEVFASIIAELGEPLAAPSANRFQGISPTAYRHVLQELGPHGLDAVVDGGDCRLGIESTVVRVSGNSLQVLRPGALPLESLRDFAATRGLALEHVSSVLDERSMQHAPGQLAKHYSPTKPVRYVDREWTSRAWSEMTSQDLCLFVDEGDLRTARECGLSSTQPHVVLGANSTEAASVLFRTLRAFDADARYATLFAFAPSNEGLGLAIADRLRRAAGS
ncbi:MAG TPA: L-threonylcarbamoyladenylate synthase [Bdellovibrionota bacterium]|jgi:L-threonylcarbamoyladenylate synthase|nr:L-threonylcarbamoyladenylate synthase [Bdellovibrionota bacterium]